MKLQLFSAWVWTCLTSYQEVGEVLHPVHDVLHGLQGRQVDADLQWHNRDEKQSSHKKDDLVLGSFTYIKVRHARLFELVPQSPGDDVNGDVVSDDSTDAGQRGLEEEEGSSFSD